MNANYSLTLKSIRLLRDNIDYRSNKELVDELFLDALKEYDEAVVMKQSTGELKVIIRELQSIIGR